MEITMDESFVQGVVGGVLNRHKDRTLDKKRIATLAVEIAANLDRASQYVDVRKPLDKTMWKELNSTWKPTNETDEQAYLDFWTCELCGKHTHEVDYDYLGSGTNHLQCELKLELGEE
tara:strand:- start:401 stop:754 length:354 start_codon:yes stop_codon:yes gene_type:complete